MRQASPRRRGGGLGAGRGGPSIPPASPGAWPGACARAHTPGLHSDCSRAWALGRALPLSGRETSPKPLSFKPVSSLVHGDGEEPLLTEPWEWTGEELRSANRQDAASAAPHGPPRFRKPSPPAPPPGSPDAPRGILSVSRSAFYRKLAGA